MLRRIPRFVMLPTVAVLFVGGIAAAATGTNPVSSLLSPDTATTSTTADAPTTTINCDGFDNHGEAVSSVANDNSTAGADHSEAVSEMAHSDCGKHQSSTTTNAPTTTAAPTSTEAPSTTAATTTTVDCSKFKNHGEAVSSIAKDKSTVGAAHGAAVSAMAQSDCGKQNSDTSNEPDADTPAAPTTTAAHGS